MKAITELLNEQIKLIERMKLAYVILNRIYDCYPSIFRECVTDEEIKQLTERII